MRIEHLHVQDSIDSDLHVVARDADLLGDIQRDFLEAMPVGDPLEKRYQHIKPGMQRAAVLAQVFDDVGGLLRHDGRGFCNHDHDDYRDHDECVA